MSQEVLNFALQLHQSGDLQQAENLYRQVLSSDPNNPKALHLLGCLAHQVHHNEEAAELIQRAIEIAPNSAHFYNNLALVLQSLTQLAKATEAAQAALSLRQNYPAALINLASILKDQDLLDDSLNALRAAIELDESSHLAHSNYLYTLYFHPNLTPADIFAQTRAWAERHADPLATPAPTHPRNSRIRVGYVSANFRRQVIGQYLLPLLAHHDRTQFEIYCYTDLLVGDDLTPEFQSHADVWRHTHALSDAQLADQIRADNIDILVDLSSHLANNRLLTFARKPAPIQFTYLAHPASTGMKTMDFILTDPFLDPPDESTAHHTESLIRIPKTYLCYPIPADAPEVADPPSLSTGHITFGSTNNFCKLNLKVFRLWADILKAVPNSRLVIRVNSETPVNSVTINFFKNCGVSAERIELVPPLSRAKYFDLLNRIDILLDPFPYAGYTTSLDAIYMGVPSSLSLAKAPLPEQVFPS